MSLLGIPVHPEVLRLARIRKRITHRSLAEQCGVVQTTISRIEYGLRNPSPELLDRLIEVLDITDIDALLTDEGRKIYTAPARTEKALPVVRRPAKNNSKKHPIGA